MVDRLPSPPLHLFVSGAGVLVPAAVVVVDETVRSGRPSELGPLLENFVGSELLKQISFGAPDVRLLHYRNHSGHEVDFVLEKSGGRVVGIEVKSATTLSPDDWSEFRSLGAYRYPQIPPPQFAPCRSYPPILHIDGNSFGM